VGGGGVGEGAELVEIASGAEGRSSSAEDHLGDRRVAGDGPESLHQGVAHLRGECVPLLRPVQRELEPGAGSAHQHGGLRARLLPRRGGSPREPVRELGPALERRVHQRLRDQPLLDVEPGALPEQLHQRHRGERRPAGGVEDRCELLPRAHHEVEAIADRVGRRSGGVADEGHRGARKRAEAHLHLGDDFAVERASVGVEGHDQDRVTGQRREVFGGVGRLKSLDGLPEREDSALRSPVYVSSPSRSARSFRRSSFPSSL
jgi:hypothetical protein